MEKEIRILIVDAKDEDAELVEWELQKAKLRFVSERAWDRESFLQTLHDFRPDIILSDYVFNGYTVLSALKEMKDNASAAPVIVVSSSSSEDLAKKCLRAGASGCVSKRQLYSVVPAVMDALVKKRMKEEREDSRALLQRSEEKYRLLFEANPQPMWVYQRDTLVFLDVNRAAIAQYGYTREEFLKMTLLDIRPEEDVPIFLDALANGNTNPMWRHKRKDGSLLDVSITVDDILYEGKQALLVLAQDVTEKRRAEIALEESERRFRETLENVQMIALTLDQHGQITFCNDFLLNLTGWSRKEIIGQNWFEQFVPAEDRHHLTSSYLQHIVEGAIQPYRENVIITRSGARRTISWNNTMLRNLRGEVVGVTSIGQDITERKHAEEALRESEKRYRLLFERNLAGVYRATTDGRILDCNESFAKILGFESPDRILKHSMFEFYFHPNKRKAFLDELREKQIVTNFETSLKRSDGTLVWVLQNVSFLPQDEGQPEVIEGTLVDITERKLAEQRLEYLANYDLLTDLPTRLLFRDRLKQATIDASKHGHLVGVLLLDLDRFKTINDTLGHEAGDILLRQVAQRLATNLSAGDTVARSGADEFTIILRDIQHVQQVADEAKKILALFERPLPLLEHELFITVSIGITLFPLDDNNLDNLLKNAETAMYKAKTEGRNNYQFFTAEMHLALLKQLSLETSLRRALERQEFLLYYQPKVQISTGKIVGVEALVKWQHADLGIIPPSQFIPLAEETGAIVPLGEWVLRTACKQAREWHMAGHSDVSVAVNISARQFKGRELPAVIESILQETGYDPRLLELELTETILMQSTPEPLQKLRDLKKLGVRISIDDFGTGFSSLNYLKQFPIDTLKIDQSFVRDIPLDPNDTLITRAIILLAHSLRRKVVAEGVETAEQLEFLRAENCDEMQGFYFSQPLPPYELEQLLREHKKMVS